MTNTIKGVKDFTNGFTEGVKVIGTAVIGIYVTSFELSIDCMKALRKIRIERKIEKLKDKLEKMEEA